MRDHGTGSIFKDSRGYWSARIELPPTNDGKRRQKWIRSKSKATVIQKLNAARTQLDTQGDILTNSPTFKDYSLNWLKSVAAERLTNSTLNTYEGYVKRWIIPGIGPKVKISNVTTQHILEMRKFLRDSPSKTKKPLSPASQLQIHNILSVMLRDAVRAGYLPFNPASKERIDRPRKVSPPLEVLTLDEARRVLEVAAEQPDYARWALALYHGLRQGEALGLERSALDLEAGVLRLEWQLQKFSAPPRNRVGRDIGDGYWLVPPKTVSSRRVQPLVEPVLSILREHCARPRPAAATHDLLFRREDGGPLYGRRDRDRWQWLLAEAGVNRNVRVHDARHTAATLMLEAGVELHVIQQILGHSSSAMTQHYSHVSLDLARAAMTRLAGSLASS
ncbi:tyrosine-type recombinase/integrase [Dermabacteraceae bacterium P13138]